MSIRPEEVQHGDILVGHALLMTPSLLLDKNLKLDEGRLLDFCNLINAVTLHDRIISLPATVPDTLKDSRLYRYLKNKGILLNLQIGYDEFSQEEKWEIESLMGYKTPIPERDIDLVLNSIHDSYHTDRGYKKYSELHPDTAPTDGREIHQQRDNLINEIIKRRSSDWTTDDFSALLKVPDSLSTSFDSTDLSREEEIQLHFLRTAGYWEISGKYNLPFLPDFMRIPLISTYNARLRESLRMFINTKVDDAVRTELESALQIASPLSVPVPHLVSNFLKTYYKSGMEEALDEIRDEFKDHRKAIVDWEKKIFDSNLNSYAEVLKIMREINDSLNALQKQDVTNMGVAVGATVTGDAIGSLLSGGISTGGLGSYVEQGINLIRRWRQRTRVSYFDSGIKDASKIKGQNELLTYAFGTTLTDRQTDRFLALTKSLERLILPLDER